MDMLFLRCWFQTEPPVCTRVTQPGRPCQPALDWKHSSSSWGVPPLLAALPASGSSVSSMEYTAVWGGAGLGVGCGPSRLAGHAVCACEGQK